MLTKEQLTDAYEQGLSISTRNGNIKIVAILDNVYGINHFNTKQVQWWLFEQFEEQEATIEQPKTKIDLSILKEGEIYFGKTNESNWIFKFKELINNNHIRGSNFYDFEDFIQIYEGCLILLTDIRLPTESELELFYSKFPDLKPKPKYNGRAVKCDNVEQANWLLKVTNFDYELTDNNYLVKTDGGYCSEIYAIRSNYEIISFSDYCKENNLTEPKFIQGFEVKDGYNDVVMVSDNLKSWHINILQSVNNGLQPFCCGFHSWKYCRYLNKNEINEIKFVE